MFDTRIQSRIFAADGSDLYYTRNADLGAGATFTKLTSNLPTGFITPTSVEFIANNGVNALLVGGLNQPSTCTPAPNGCIIASTQSPITAADSDSSGLLSNWRAFGQGLPNTVVEKMAYNDLADVLAVSSIGRGAYVLCDVTSYFPQASQLWFGLANNDSAPDASYLTDGTVGSRPLIKYGSGLLTIAGDATYTGGTTIEGGALMLGTGGASGSVKGNITFCSDSADTQCDTSTNKMLGFNRSDVYAYNGVISGPGQVFQLGSGTTVMGGASTYSGPTYVNAGTAAGGRHRCVLAEQHLQRRDRRRARCAWLRSGYRRPDRSRAGHQRSRRPPNADDRERRHLCAGQWHRGLVDVSRLQSRLPVRRVLPGPGQWQFGFICDCRGHGHAGRRNGAGQFRFEQWQYLQAVHHPHGCRRGQRHVRLVSADLPTTLTPNLSYSADDAFLNLTLSYNALGNLSGNQQNVGNALTNFFNANGSIPSIFATLTPAALSQVAGETATGSQQTTFQAMTEFITTLLDPFIDGREGASNATPPTAYATRNTSASAYADTSKSWSERERAAYNAVFTKAPLRQVYDPHWSVWAAAFGGSQTTDGNAATGSNSATSRIFGVAAGADYLLSPRTIAGFGLAGGGTNFSVANAGTGRSDLFQAGAYVRHTAGNAYLSAALAYGWQDVTTDRMAISDKLHAEFDANALSGRVEGGYRFATKWMGIAPYAAGQFTTFFLPDYAESAVFGSNAFALAYGAQNVTDARTELGFRTDKSFALATGLLTLRSRFAWAHDFDPNRNIAASFQALPGASFVVGGAAQASESELTTLSAEMKWRNGWSASATFEGEFSQVTASYAGKGVVRYVW